MFSKWNDKEPKSINNGQPIATKISLLDGGGYQPKLLKKAPSMRAINNYNNISTESDTPETYDNLTFIPENEDIDKYSREFEQRAALRSITLDNIVPDMPTTKQGHIYTNEDCNNYDYPTMASKSSYSNTLMSSDTDMRRDELGSTAQLVSPKIRESCRTCLSFVETVLCTISLAAGIGNLYRLPQAVIGNGGLPFLVAYVILVVLIGLPLLFLELGIGQIVQDGYMRTWRAVPFFRGIGYIKLLAGFMIAVYYPLYMGLSLFYLIWFAKKAPPFSECAFIKMEVDGYKADGISGEECLKKTFLMSPFEEPSWFGIYSGILLLIWFIVLAWCIKRSKTYEKALIIFLLCTAGCLIALIVKAIDTNRCEGVEKLISKANWNILKLGEVWYYALIQVFFSTNIGFGVFTTNAGIIYKKANPFWTSLGYIFINLVVGILSVFLFYIVSSNIDPKPSRTSIYEMHLLTHIYEVVLKSKDVDMQIWSVVAYMTILFAGFISTITIMYTIIKAISVETRNRLSWWHLSLILSFICFILGSAILLYPNLEILHMIDHYVVGNLVLITVILEVFAFIIFYGPTRLQSDFEFILGNRLSKIWIILWSISPFVLSGIFIWALATMDLRGHLTVVDSLYCWGIGWSIVVIAVIIILIMGFHNVSQQDSLTLCDKFKSSFKHSRKWGPSDTMMLHSWIQWHTKSQDGERDFTLKRRGTKEYTHSIKNRSKYHKDYTPTVSDSSTISGTLTYKKGDPPEKLAVDGSSEPYYLRNNYEKSYRVTSLIDAIDTTPVHSFNRPAVYNGDYKTNYNPLAYINNINVNGLNDAPNDGSTSEGYGTYRKGPYVIEDDGLQHVCHRKNNIYEQATEL